MAEEARIKQALKRKRSSAKARFHLVFNSVTEAFQNDCQVEVLSQMTADLETAYKNLEEKHEEYLEKLSPIDEDDKNTEKAAKDDMNTNYQELCDIRKKMVIRREAVDERKKSKEGKPVKSELPSLKVTRLAPPSFTGNIRDYPTFRKDYERHMQSAYGKDAFALRGCLSGNAKLTVQGVDDSYDEMWARLDQKYGRPEKLIDAVLSELKGLQQVPDNDCCKFVKMVEIVEKCWLDLKKMKMSHEMDTAAVVSQVEKLLPTLQKREWALARQKLRVDERCTFSMLLDYLKEQKNAMEYMSVEMRRSSESIKSRTHTLDVSEEKDEKEMMKDVVHMMQSQMKLMREELSQVVNAVSNATNSQRTQYTGNTQFLGNNARPNCWLCKNAIADHNLVNCQKFNSLDPAARVEAVRQNSACFCCLKVGHTARRCYNRIPCNFRVNNGDTCSRFHHQKLHIENIQRISNHNHAQYEHAERSNVLLMVSEVRSGHRKLNVLWDPGANISLISKQAAANMKLKGREVHLSITKVGNITENMTSLEYLLHLTDVSGKIWTIPVYEIEDITAKIQKTNLNEVVRIFKNISESEINRPIGKVHVLIGLDWCELMPENIEQVGKLQLMRNPFGFCVRGSHPMIKNYDSFHNNLQINSTMGVIEEGNLHSIQLKQLSKLMETFMDIERQGISRTAECNRCSTGTKNCTIKEEREMIMINQGLTLDREAKCWVVKYPWTKDPELLPNNYPAAAARLYSTEKRLTKMGKEYSSAYKGQIDDMLDRKVVRRLTAKEIAMYSGPIHYIPHHEVLKPDSTSTPMRIVFNSSSCSK